MGKNVGGIIVMSIKIYTYSDPYKLKEESFWDKINNALHLCVSQTMVNGMTELYPSLKKHTTTFMAFLNEFYNNWEKINTKVRQMMEVDNAVERMTISSENADHIRRSLAYNIKSLVSCIRIFKELGLIPENADCSKLNIDQIYLLQIYQIICQNRNSAFSFTRVETEAEIDTAIQNILKQKNKAYPYDTITHGRIVIHGVHQFTPSMLCAIEDISRYKEVILLFNYQQQYSNIYKTWLKIYSLFDTKITISNENRFSPISLYVKSYPCNVLADSMGKITEGDFFSTANSLQNIEVLEFENVTEFAGYCALLFDNAKTVRNNIPNAQKHSVLGYMSEQLYSASGKVNDILRAYFPEQFGERHFLDYPIGHFFVSAMELWDYSAQKIKVDNISDIKECLSSGIINEQQSGKLLSTFNTVEQYISGITDFEQIIDKLSKLKKYVGRKQSELCRIGYMNVAKADLVELIMALKELKKIVEYFFTDFNKGGDNFNRFYQRIHHFLTRKTQEMQELDEEIKEVLARLLERMNEIDLPDTGTFICLKQTMSYYLSQNDNVMAGANWIVRNFEQIDGDILRSRYQSKKDIVYHFCCLSDKDICTVNNGNLPWPLDIHFFEYAYDCSETKYRIYLCAKYEAVNFKKYALLYGLAFNRTGVKLSYVKNDKENELYHIFRILGVKTKKYRETVNTNFVSRVNQNTPLLSSPLKFNDRDYIRYRMCPYKFAVESIVQETTVYRQRFLIIFYMRVLLENRIKEKYTGQKISDSILKTIIMEEYDNLDDKFHLSNAYEKTQIISGVYRYLKNTIGNDGRMPCMNFNYRKIAEYREDFLIIDNQKLKNEGNASNLTTVINMECWYRTKVSAECMYCASKDVCLRFTDKT